MTTRTTVRLTDEQQLMLRKMALLDGSQTRVISIALACRWAEIGERAEEVWQIVEGTAIARREGEE
jgi:hypothetical protein